MAKAMESKIKVSELIPDDKNFNKGSEFGNSLISKSFEKFGAGRSILIDKNNKIIAGNKSTENYGAGGGQDVIVVESDGTKLIAVKRTDIDLDTPEGRELALADNATAKANIVWAEDVIASELGVEVGESWGVDMGKEIPEAEEDDFDTTPPEIPITVLGDLYEIGEHRLLCGDSTDSDQVAKLMNGEKADMVFTDPPYGVSYQSNMRDDKFEVLKNDDVFLTEWVNNLPIFSKGFVFVWTSWKVITRWIDICSPIGDLSNIIIWHKGAGSMGDLKKTFSSDYEVCLCYNRGAEIIGKRIGSVWSISTDGGQDYLHPTQKPVKLAQQAIENILLKNKICLDLFLGSGTTMVASHQLKRKCYGMELDPKYCDVIVKRMITLDPTLTIKLNGVDVTNEWKA